jgi:hypothetical protein
MYRYPEMDGPSKAPHEHCIGFEKLDGSNMRFEWSPKRGWHKFGSRSQLIDPSYPILGKAIPIFMRKYAEPIEKIIRDSKAMRNAQCVTAFAELFGPSSFAGRHDENDEMDLVLFDFHVHKSGIMGPRDFLRTFDSLHTPRLIYEGVLNDTLVNDIKAGAYDVDEGIVCKGGSGHKLWMRKIKTQAYIDRLKSSFGDDWKRYGE